MASLVCEGMFLPLDMEPQEPGEDEVKCAMRLLERVLKDDRPELMKDAKGFFRREKAHVYKEGQVRKECWDIEDFRLWDQLDVTVRVVCSQETVELFTLVQYSFYVNINLWQSPLNKSTNILFPTQIFKTIVLIA